MAIPLPGFIEGMVKTRKELCAFLTNIFGFYVQFLPIVLKYIDASRKEVGIEVKLCQWEHGKSHLSFESMKKSRQKLRKLIQKFTDVLQELMSIFLNQEGAQRGAKARSFHNHKPTYDVTSKGLVDGSFDLTLFNENRFMWFDNIGGGLDSAFQNLLPKKTSVLDIIPLHGKEIKSIFRPCRDSQRTLCLKGWRLYCHLCHCVQSLFLLY